MPKRTRSEFEMKSSQDIYNYILNELNNSKDKNTRMHEISKEFGQKIIMGQINSEEFFIALVKLGEIKLFNHTDDTQ